MSSDQQNEAFSAEKARAAGEKLRELTATLTAKREAYAQVAAMIRERLELRARINHLGEKPTDADRLVLREIEAIETAMHAASQVRP